MRDWIICGGTDWYRPSVTSTVQIMRQFKNKGYNVLWINPIAFKSPRVNSVNRKSMIKKILNKFSTHLKIYKKAESGFHIYIPVYLPLFNNFGDRVNEILIKLQFRVLVAVFSIDIKNAILWTSGSFTLSPILSQPFKHKIYHAADLISAFRTNNKRLLETLKQKEVFLCKNVDHIFASSNNIKEKLEIISNRKVNLLLHGVDFNHFNKEKEINHFMMKIRSQGLPIAGYYGTLSDANDKEVFKHLADNGYNVVIIGQLLGDYSLLSDHKHIHFMGPVSYKILPSYAQAFDLCLLNWIMADWIRNSYPVKTLEYLSMGKPVVSCHIPILERLFGDLIYFAGTKEEFLSRANEALQNDTPEKRQNRIRAASQHTWDKKFKIIEEILL